MKLPFRRKKQETQENVPEEVQEYYQAERRERVGIAWVLALTTLAATVLLAIGLFYGGRWVYRSVFEDDQSTEIAEQEEAAEEETNLAPTQEDNEADNLPDELPATDETDSAETNSPESDESTDEESDDSDQTAAPDTPETTPTTGALPNTGPGDSEL